MDRITKGRLCELVVVTRLVKEGFTVALPLGSQRGWDILLEEGGRWVKLQVKMSYQSKGRGSLYVDCIRSGNTRTVKRPSSTRAYQAGDFDYLVAVAPETGAIWRIPGTLAIGRRALALKPEWIWFV